jgi:hypothetical protein
MDAAPSPYVNDLSRQLATIRDGLRSPLSPADFDGSFIELDDTRGQRPPTALERARARWRYAQIAE